MAGEEEKRARPAYKDLLAKYIEHIGRCQGLDFLTSAYRFQINSEYGFSHTSVFTEEEWQQLQKLSGDKTHRETRIFKDKELKP